MKHVYHRLGYDALPKQVKEYSDPNSKVYRGVRDSANMTAKEFLDNIKFGEMMISGAKSSSKGRGLYFTELVSYAKNHAKPNGLISEWGISDDVYSIGIKDLDSIGSRIKQLRVLKDTSDWMDNQYDILAIAAGYDMIDAGSTKNIMNREDACFYFDDPEELYWPKLTPEERENVRKAIEPHIIKVK